MKKVLVSLSLLIAFGSCKEAIKDDKVAAVESGIGQQLTSTEKELLTGTWVPADQDKEASFAIADSTVYYLDQEGSAEFAYKLVDRSILIYFTGLTSASRIDKVSKDSLVLTTEGIRHAFKRGVE